MRVLIIPLVVGASFGCSSSGETERAPGSGGASTGGAAAGGTGTGAASNGGAAANGGAPSAGGAGGAPASGGLGGAGAAGSGGLASGGAAGSGGMAASGGAAAGGSAGRVITPPPSLDGLDLTLGGMNADLMPSLDCLSKDSPVPACMSVVGMFGDTRFTDCAPFSFAAGSGSGTYTVSCDVDQEDESFDVTVGVGRALAYDTPSTFSFANPPEASEDTAVSFFYSGPGGELGALGFSIDDGRFTAEMRLAGGTWIGAGSVTSVARSRFIRGVFALVATPTAACAPKVNSLPCKTLRLRGVFTARVEFDAG